MSLTEIDTAAFNKAYDLAIASGTQTKVKAVNGTEEKNWREDFIEKLALLLTHEHELIHSTAINATNFKRKCAEVLRELAETKGIDYLIAKKSRQAVRFALESGLAQRVSVTPPSINEPRNPLENKLGY